MLRLLSIGVLGVCGLAVAAGSPRAPESAKACDLPRPAHTVVVIMENHSYAQIAGNLSAPTLTPTPSETPTPEPRLANPPPENSRAPIVIPFRTPGLD